MTDRSPAPPPLRRILVPTDFSDGADRALAHALRLARQHAAEVHLLHVVSALVGDEGYSPLLYSPEASASKETLDAMLNTMLREAVERHDARGVRVERVKERANLAVAPQIVAYAERRGVDLIVMGMHGRRGPRRFLLGSVAEEAVRCATCDVLTVRSDGEERRTPEDKLWTRILVPVDLSEHAKALRDRARFAALSTALLARAVALARTETAHLDVLHVVEPLPSALSLGGLMTIYDVVPDFETRVQRQLEVLLRSVSADSGVTMQAHVAEGRVAKHIVAFAEEHDTDLIMIATHGRSGAGRFLLGSVTERVVRTAPCPVWTARRFQEERPDSRPAADAASALQKSKCTPGRP